jgi:hypothetical protein
MTGLLVVDHGAGRVDAVVPLRGQDVANPSHAEHDHARDAPAATRQRRHYSPIRIMGLRRVPAALRSCL